uniref:Adenosinetriphosphatase n=1 Tax=Opuntia streptacantha TaxID=393608 RepID=A0A7C9AKV8_OPUST
MEEAEHKQQSDVWMRLKKKRTKLVENWNAWRKPQDVEPGVGKWVSYLNREKKLDSLVGPRPVPPVAPRGLYLYGNVGSGKTMLMDMFYGATEGVVKHRRRLHFHEAMLEIHERMHKVWKKQMEEKTLQSSISSWIINLPFDAKVKEWLAAEEQYKREVEMQNILPTVADKFLLGHQEHKQGATLLCFDEIQTVDVFAIVALSGILSRLLSTGSVLVATSNRAPQDLNQDGMQKEIFQKLVEKMGEHCQIVPIGSDIDYRRLIAEKSVIQVHYFYPFDSKALLEFEKMWSEITSQYGGVVTSETIRVMFGRTLDVPESCNGVARFSYEYLCGRAVGAADYISVANKYHTVFISGIPVMSMRIRDKARRFITLVDELYNHHCRLVCSAACSIEDLFQGTEEGTLFDLESFQFETEIEGSKLRRDVLAEGSVGSGGSPTGIISILSAQEEMFAFRRAVSRLIEMQTPFYLEGVRYLHPYFQRQPSNRENDLARTLQHQTPS